METRHQHQTERVSDAEEGWVFDPFDGGVFVQKLGPFGPVSDGENRGGSLEILVLDGKPELSYSPDVALSLVQAREFRGFFEQAMAALERYRPPAWMLDPAELEKRREQAFAEEERRFLEACPVCGGGDR